MSIGELGSLGEFVGGILVAVSLIYLAVQVRQGNRAMRVSAFQSAVQSSNEWSAYFVNDPELGALFNRGVANRTGLNPMERARFDEMLMIFLRNYSATVLLEEEGFVRRGDISSAFEAGLRRFFASPDMLRWWKRHEQYIARSAAEEIAEALARLHPPQEATSDRPGPANPDPPRS